MLISGSPNSYNEKVRLLLLRSELFLVCNVSLHSEWYWFPIYELFSQRPTYNSDPSIMQNMYAFFFFFIVTNEQLGIKTTVRRVQNVYQI